MMDETKSAGGASPGRDGDGGGADRSPLKELADFLQVASRLPPRKLRRLLAAVRDAARRLDS